MSNKFQKLILHPSGRIYNEEKVFLKIKSKAHNVMTLGNNGLMDESKREYKEVEELIFQVKNSSVVSYNLLRQQFKEDPVLSAFVGTKKN